ncbi:MAG: aminotransferase class III-fold pyridoxal phosphate-dependent enzyme [Thioploca sp.]|nr:aminotransferase class III-fold pyridoxal phosphate-dependent enzyme [Thioploca sp.]
MSNPNALNPELHRLLEICHLDLTWVRGEGVWLDDHYGRRFLDGYAQYGAVILGHNFPAAVAALQEALTAQQPAMVQPYRAPHAVALAEKLVQLAPYGLTHCVFTTSGAETVEAAIKLVRMRTGRSLILSCIGSYHGKTMGALAASGQARYQNDFGLVAPGFAKIPFGDSEALAAFLHQHHQQVAALFLEPIQGERGVIMPPSGYLRTARELCSQYGIPLVLDEIQTGLGRTGKLFCCEYENITPDVLLLAKGLGGGLFPLGAMLVNATCWDGRFALNHSSTFANNNLACRVGLAVLNALTETDIIAQVAAKGTQLLNGLQQLAQRYPHTIAAVRGQGLLGAIQLRPHSANAGLFRSYLEHQGLYAYTVASLLAEQANLLVLPTLGDNHVLRLAPPLIISAAELDQLLKGLEQVLAQLEPNATEVLVRNLTRTSSVISLAARRQEPLPIILPPLPRPQMTEPSYAFIMHYTRWEDILITDPTLARLSSQKLHHYVSYMAQMPAGVVYEVLPLRSPGGTTAKGWLIALGMLPEMMVRRGRAQMVTEIKRAVDLAVELGAQIVGLGAFTSTFSRRGQAVTGRGAVITTGNALTAGMAVAALHQGLAQQEIDLTTAKIGIVGASGSVGSLCAKLLARAHPAALTLIGNPNSGLAGLQRLATQLAASYAIPVDCSTDLAVLRHCNVVLSATSAGRSVLDKVPFRHGTFICDVARPPDTSTQLRQRADLTVIEGGLVALPDPTLSFGTGNIQGFPNGIQLACLSETILLTLAGETQDRGIGDEVPLTEVDRIMALADKHGFRLAELPRKEQPWFLAK